VHCVYLLHLLKTTYLLLTYLLTYASSEQNVGIERRTSVCCVLFGVTIVYIASIIIHFE